MEELIRLLEEELKLLEQMEKQSVQQEQLLKEDKLDALNVSLDKVQALVEKINGLHQISDPLMQSYVLTAKDDYIEQLRKKIREKVEICSAFNAKSISALTAMTSTQKEKIDEQSAKRKGIGGYIQMIPNTPEMFDRNA